MNKDFKSRFMPDVYFKISGNVSKIHDVVDIDYLKMGFSYFYVSYCGSKLFPVKEYQKQGLKEVSIYEAIPELIPDGMRYNKELDKLVPDIINIEFEKVKFDDFVDNCEQILKRENGFIKADKKKINFSLVDPYAYEDLGKCLTIGAEKYDSNNWKLGDIETYISALDRHLLDIKKAVADKDKALFIDKDTTLQHGANLLCNAMFLHYFIRKELEEK